MSRAYYLQPTAGKIQLDLGDSSAQHAEAAVADREEADRKALQDGADRPLGSLNRLGPPARCPFSSLFWVGGFPY